MTCDAGSVGAIGGDVVRSLAAGDDFIGDSVIDKDVFRATFRDAFDEIPSAHNMAATSRKLAMAAAQTVKRGRIQNGRGSAMRSVCECGTKLPAVFRRPKNRAFATRALNRTAERDVEAYSPLVATGRGVALLTRPSDPLGTRKAVGVLDRRIATAARGG